MTKRRKLIVHTLMAKTFLGNKPTQKHCVDHIDNNRTNNSLCNLRYCTQQQNLMNQGINCVNTSGVKGVCFSKKAKKWLARIVFNSKTIHIGYYDLLSDAKQARIQKAKELYGSFINKCEI